MKRRNRIKAALREGREAYGYYLTFPSPSVVEILGVLDFDYVLIDGEHGVFCPDLIEDICRAAESVNVTPIARSPDITSGTIGGYLARGVQGILGPHVSTKADAEQFVRACLFAPLGERSFGERTRGTHYDFQLADRPAYYRECNENMLVWALLEDTRGVENIGEITSVEGIDLISIGPIDFAQSLGFPGQPNHPEVVKAINGAYDRVRAAGRLVGKDVMISEWISEFLISAGQQFLARPLSREDER